MSLSNEQMIADMKFHKELLKEVLTPFDFIKDYYSEHMLVFTLTTMKSHLICVNNFTSDQLMLIPFLIKAQKIQQTGHVFSLLFELPQKKSDSTDDVYLRMKDLSWWDKVELLHSITPLLSN